MSTPFGQDRAPPRSRDRQRLFSVLLCVLGASVLTHTRASQAQGQTVTVAPGPEYDAGGFYRLLFGREYRELWTTPIEVPVVDLATFEGGVTPVSRSGGQQTRGLRLRAADGREFFFRSIDKDPSAILPPDLRGTVASSVIRDQTSSAHPTAPLVVDRLLNAAGIPHVQPHLIVLADEPSLGEFRADYAGLMGIIEQRVGGSGVNGTWGGASEIIDSDSLFARVQRSPDDQVDTRALLTARLFDVLIGDWDRHRDQWRWARYNDSVPRHWRPIPIDRDQAFAKYDGVLLGVARQAAPQLTNFGSSYPSMVGATWNGRELDRRFLARLDRAAWDSAARALQTALNDSVINQAVRALPRQHYTLNGVVLADWIRQRRKQLPEAAKQFYRLLAGQVDVRATDEAEFASLTRGPDGSVVLVLSRGRADTAGYLRQSFDPDDTKEVRLFLGEGADSATVGGTGSGITLRILGEGGEDLLADSSEGGKLRFYDDSAGPARTAGHSRSVDRKPFRPPESRNPRALPPRDWGHRWQPMIWFSAGPDLGLFLGAGQTLTTYGFRKIPFASQHRLRAGFATTPATFRVDYRGLFQRENSGTRFELFLRGSGIEVTRFHGFGNEIEAPEEDRFYRVTSDQFLVAPAVSVALGPRARLTLGPELEYSSTDDRSDRFLTTLDPYGSGNFGQVGGRMSVRVDTRDAALAASRGVTLEVGGAIHPDWWDVRELYGEAYGVATTYLTLPAPLTPTFAFRAGGRKLWGDYPYFQAAFIGGTETVRLGRPNRFAGDASAYGSAELRLSLFRTMTLVPTDVGVFGLADIGRVFLEGESSDQWHSAVGGGIWFGFLSRANAFSLAVAASEERTRLYAQVGFGF